MTEGGHRVVLVWVFVLAATTFGTCLASYVLVGDWRDGIALGVAVGVMYSAVVTFDGFLRPVEELPAVR